MPQSGFAVIDVETTGFSPSQNRVIEIAIVQMDADGVVTSEWSRRCNSRGAVGATHVHGITEADLRGAPDFADIAHDVSARLRGRVIVAHNIDFDLAFLRAEMRCAGWVLPADVQTFCTLQASGHYLPHLRRSKLVDCCAAAGVLLEDAHSALGDARATAALLGFYLTGGHRIPVLASHAESIREAIRCEWPSSATLEPLVRPIEQQSAGWSINQQQRVERKAVAQAEQAARETATAMLTDLSASAIAAAGPVPVGYVELLMAALEDGVVSSAESSVLEALIAVHTIEIDARTRVHQALLSSICDSVVDDARVSRRERGLLDGIARSLGLNDVDVARLLTDAERTRLQRIQESTTTLPTEWTDGEPLRIGDRVAFTGCDGDERARLEATATERGLRVMNNVSGLTALLVADGSFAGNKMAAAQRIGTRILPPATFARMLDHVQPARETPPRGAGSNSGSTPVREPAAGTDVPISIPDATIAAATAVLATASNAATSAPPYGATERADPARVRRWARENGLDVGERGRLGAHIFAAYEAAHPTEKSPAG